VSCREEASRSKWISPFASSLSLRITDYGIRHAQFGASAMPPAALIALQFLLQFTPVAKAAWQYAAKA